MVGEPFNVGVVDVVMMGLIKAGRVDEATDVLATWHALADRKGVVQPLNAAVEERARTLIARAEGRDADATEAARRLLKAAHDTRLVLHTLDALMLLADLAARRGDDTEAARLAGATSAARDRIGYRCPLVRHVIDVDGLAERLAIEHPDAFAEGAGLDLDGVTELAQRMRGPRGRPTSGWESLTPTERLVAEHAASGATNAQIAENLLIAVPTVKTHLTRIFTKLNVTNRTELAHTFAARPQPGDGCRHEIG